MQTAGPRAHSHWDRSWEYTPFLQAAAGWVIDDPVIFNVISGPVLPLIATDVNGDGVVNILDLVSVASSFGHEGPNLAMDVNGDGKVNILDLVWVADAFRAAEAAP